MRSTFIRTAAVTALALASFATPALAGKTTSVTPGGQNLSVWISHISAQTSRGNIGGNCATTIAPNAQSARVIAFIGRFCSRN